MWSATNTDVIIRCGTLKMFYRTSNKEKIGSGIILTLTNFVLSANEKMNLSETKISR